MAAKDMLVTIAHIGILLSFANAIYFDYTVLHDTLPLWQTFGGRWKFLTWLNVVLQSTFFLLAVINDIFGASSTGPNARRTSLQNLLDWLFTGLAWPMGTFVCVAFWGLYAVDRELVYPEYLDDIIPQWHNHMYHTFIQAFLLFECYMVYHKYPARKTGLGTTMTFVSLYLCWVFYIAFVADFWVYPVLEVLPWPGRIAFITALVAFASGLYITGEFLTNKFWKPSLDAVAKMK